MRTEPFGAASWSPPPAATVAAVVAAAGRERAGDGRDRDRGDEQRSAAGPASSLLTLLRAPRYRGDPVAELTNISLSRGRALARHRRRRRAARRRGPRVRARPSAACSPTAPRPGYLRLLEWLAQEARRRARAARGHQRLDAGGRLPVPAAVSSPATWWWSRRQPTTARCSRSATSARRSSRSRWRRTASTSTRSPLRSSAGARPEARPHHPQLPEPGRLHALARQAPAAARAGRASTASRSSRTTRTWSCASRATTQPDDARARRRRRAAWCTPRRSRRRSARASAWATWSARES